MSSLEFLFTLLSAVIAGIIGVILLLIGRKSNRRKLYRFGLAVVLTSFIALLVEFQEIREVLIAFAVIAAAIVAAYSMDEARRLRQDNADRERNDRKERYLNEIIAWLTGIEGRIFPSGRTMVEQVKESLAEMTAGGKRSNTLAKELDRLRELDEGIFTMRALTKEIGDSRYSKDVAFGLDNTLCGEIKILLEHLQNRQDLILQMQEIKKELKGSLIENIDKEEYVKLLSVNETNIEKLGLSKRGYLVAQISLNAHNVREQINKTISKAVELKTGLLKS